MRKIGFQTNRRLLNVQHISHDPTLGEDAFRQVTRPVTIDGNRVSALRFDDPTVLALLTALLVFRLLPRGFPTVNFVSTSLYCWVNIPAI